MSSQSQSLSPALDGLPKPFVTAMRTLFDIMDDQRSGYVLLSEIERRWQDDNTQGLPRGVIESLRKVTPSEGYLSFERFCAGLQICLLRNQIGERASSSSSSSSLSSITSSFTCTPLMGSNNDVPPPLVRPPSEPKHDEMIQHKHAKSSQQMAVTGQLVPPSQNIRTARAISMPQLDTVKAPPILVRPSRARALMVKTCDARIGGMIAHSQSVASVTHFAPPGPPKPPRLMERELHSLELDPTSDIPVPHEANGVGSLERENRKWDYECIRKERERDTNSYRRGRGGSLERLLDLEEKSPPPPIGTRTGIRLALHSWHKERSKSESDDVVLGKGGDAKDVTRHEARSAAAVATELHTRGRITASSREEPHGRGIGDGGNSCQSPNGAATLVLKKPSKRREPRRHTLQNGVDFSILRRLKQLEAERDMLFQGLDVVERAGNWYKQQLQAISDRIHHLPQRSPQEPSVESQQEKLHFQLARIHEVNAHLCALMEASERGLPPQLNLAIHTPSSPSRRNNGSPRQSPQKATSGGGHGENGRVLMQLKEQNVQLTQEVSQKSDLITALEREKAALLRELFQTRSHQNHPITVADSTFM